MFTFRKSNFLKFDHVSDQTRFLCVILTKSLVIEGFKIQKKVSWGIPHLGERVFRREAALPRKSVSKTTTQHEEVVFS